MIGIKKWCGSLVFSSAFFFAPLACANTLSVTIDVASLPTTITLCRDPTAHASQGVDEQWQVEFDIDNNPATGMNGVDAVLFFEPTPVTTPCTPSTVNTQGNLVAGLVKWNSSTGQFDPADAVINVATDFSHSTITLSTDVSGVFANISGNTRLGVGVYAPYSSGATVNTAQDVTSVFSLGQSVTSPANDVQGCSSPCGTGAPWYSLIDLVGASATTSETLPAFGAHTLYVEFDLAALHSSIGVCRYPSAFTSSGMIDSEWLAEFNPSGQDNGDGNGGFDTAVIVFTPPQSTPCGTQSLDTVSALSAGLFTFDGSGNFVGGDALPISVDVANGKIVVQADTSVAAFTGFSNNSLVTFGTDAIYGPNEGTYDSLSTGPFTIAFGSATDPTSDLQSCVSPCATSDAWYQEIDLKKVSVARPNEIFQNGFE